MVEPKKGQAKRLILWTDCLELARKIKADIESGQHKFNSIYGIPRGGMAVAVILSHQLELPIVDRTGINAETLIVDDISDSGNTLDDISYLFVKWHSEMVCAVLYQRNGTEYEADYVGEYIDNNDWIVFPWEVN